MSLYNHTNYQINELDQHYYDMSAYEIKLDELHSPQQSETSDDSNLLPLPSTLRSSSTSSGSHDKSNVDTTNTNTVDKSSLTRGPWTKEEDTILFSMVSKLGPERWVIIAKELGTRNGKQCRERWHNHLDPSIIKSPFTPEEDAKIWELFHSLGPRWALMAKEMPGRPDNSIKNHFNTVLRPRRIFKKKEAESQAAAASQSSESSTILTPQTESTSEFEKPPTPESLFNEINTPTLKRKSTSNTPKRSYKKSCKKTTEAPSPQAESPWPISSHYPFSSYMLDELPSSYPPLYGYPTDYPPPPHHHHSLPHHSDNFHPQFLPNHHQQLYNPFTLTSLSSYHQNLTSPIPKVLTMDEPDWDFLQQLGNELGLPLNLN